MISICFDLNNFHFFFVDFGHTFRLLVIQAVNLAGILTLNLDKNRKFKYWKSTTAPNFCSKPLY